MDGQVLIFADQTNREMFSAEALTGKALKVRKYSKIFKNEALIKILESDAINETIDAFIKGGLNLTHASSYSYVHRNTLIYRIEKVYKTIGLDLKNFEDCLIFVNMREVYRMVKKHDV